MLRGLVLLFAVLLLSACSREARLYPIDAPPGSGPLRAKFTDSGMGSGPVEVTMPDGEVLKGEFSTTDTSSYGFGTAIASTGRTSAIASGSSAVMSGSMPGVLTAMGPNGTTVQCEYIVNTFTSSGSGTCETNKGHSYNLHF